MGSLSKPEVLTYRFHNFRPSDREALRVTATQEGGDRVFVSALEIYLRKWAIADWLTEYDLERIAVWTALHLPRQLNEAIAAMAAREASSAITEQAKKTFTVMHEAVQKELKDVPADDLGEMTATP